MRPPIIDKNQSYTFHDYFKLDPPIDELLTYFGYQYQTDMYTLPTHPIDKQLFGDLKSILQDALLYVDLNSEAARRESLISPVLLRVAFQLKMRVRIEYPLKINDQLKGKIDYFMHHKNNILVVEAKKGDLQRGFTQLAVELIAMDHWLDEDAKPIYGAVTMGDAWRFGSLDRQSKVITHDINLYTIPKDLDELLQILLGILEGHKALQ